MPYGDFLRAAGAGDADAVEQASDAPLADFLGKLPLILDAGLRIGGVIGAETVGQTGHLSRLLLDGHARDQIVHALHLRRGEGTARQWKGQQAGKGGGQDGAAGYGRNWGHHGGA